MLQLTCIFSEDAFFKPMMVKGDEGCLYWAVASHIMSFCFDDVWMDRFLTGKKPGIKLATFEAVHELKQFVSQKNFVDQEVNDFIKEMIEE